MKIFCIGNSRTGTTSLHYFLKAAGYKSIHHYEWAIAQPEGSGDDQEKEAFIEFVTNSGYNAFTDHPTRKYYKEIATAFPDAYIINTKRDRHELTLSVVNFFGFDQATARDWIEYHFKQEEEIEAFFRENSHYNYVSVSICEDGDASSLIKSFLGITGQQSLVLGNENQSGSGCGSRSLDELPVSVRMQLGYYKLFTPPPRSDLRATIEYLENCCKPGTALPSESSHYYLINDANHSIRQYLGLNSPDNKKFAVDTGYFDGIADACDKVGAQYRVFAVPEKYSIYPEYLPDCLVENFFDEIKSGVRNHPSQQVEATRTYYVNAYSYLLKKKSYGDLYLHGDSHLSSIGSYHFLRLINAIMLDVLNESLGDIPDTFTTPVLASWLGDLASQVPEDLRSYINRCFCHNKNLPYDNSSGLKNVSYTIYYPPTILSHVATEAYEGVALKYLPSSQPETKYTNVAAPIKKKVVVFGDSTATNILPSLTTLYEEVISIRERAFFMRRDVVLGERPDFVVLIIADRFVCGIS